MSLPVAAQDTLCCPTSWSLLNLFSSKHIAIIAKSTSGVVLESWSDDDLQTVFDEVMSLFGTSSAPAARAASVAVVAAWGDRPPLGATAAA